MKTLKMLTTWGNHGLTVGDVVKCGPSSRWKTLRMLLTRPRHTVVVEATATTVTLGEARMTWGDWWRCLWRTVVYGA